MVRRWIEHGSGWHQIGDDPELGTLTRWDDAPEGASVVRMEFQGVVVDEPVCDGAYLFVWWRVRCPEEDWPRRVAILTPSGWNDCDEFEFFRGLFPGEKL